MAERRVSHAPRRLTRNERSLAALAAALLIGVGLIGAFWARNDAATAVILAAGGLLLLVAINGNALSRVTIAGHAVEWEQGRLEDARVAYGQGDEEGAERIFGELVRSAPIAPVESAEFGLSWRPGTAAGYERLTLNTISSVLPPGATFESTENERVLSRLDAIIHVENRSIGVEVRAGTRFNLSEVVDRLAGAVAYALPRIDGMIFVVNVGPTENSYRRLRTAIDKLAVPVEVVAWRPEDPPKRLRDAIQSIIDRLRADLQG